MNWSDNSRLGIVVAMAFGVVASFVVVTYLARTEPVIGPVLEKKFAQWVDRRDANLRIESMRPAGLYGLRFDGIEADWKRGAVRIAVRAETLEVRPSIGALLEGRLAVGTVDLSTADIDLRTSATHRDGDDAARVDTDPSIDVGRRDTPQRQTADSTSPPEVDVTLDDVRFRLTSSVLDLTPPPITLDRAEFRLAPANGSLGLTHAIGRGSLGDEVPFALTSRYSESKNTGRPIARVEFASPSDERVSLESLAGSDLPATVEFGRISACPDCTTPRLCARDASLFAQGANLESSAACAEIDANWLRFSGEETIVRGPEERTVGRLTEIQGEMPVGGETIRLQGNLYGRDGGEADVRVTWNRRDEFLGFRTRSERLQLEPFWPAFGLGETVSDGLLDGRLEGRINPNTAEVTLRGDLAHRSIRLRHPFLSSEPLRFGAGRIEFDAETDFDLRELESFRARASLGGLEPAQIRGQLVQTERGTQFAVDLDAEHLDASGLRDTLPESLARPALGARMEGCFSISVDLTGHTAAPEQLELDVGVGGDVQVRRESPYSDVRGLASNGPPNPALTLPGLSDGGLEHWVPLDSLPSHLPEVLLAAEDVEFRRHPGFSWRGVRLAMRHNLKMGRLERGGSTITQQVAKNLFLSKRRTLARKIREAWVSWRLESALSKDRILELYLNLVEWGPNIRGLHSAADHFFGREPDDLSIPQMALLSALLPGPELYGRLVDRGFLPSSRVEKFEHIMNNLKFLGMIQYNDYEEYNRRALAGEIGGLDLTVCRDDRNAPDGAPDCP